MAKSTAVAETKQNLPAEILEDIFDMAGEGVDYDASELQIPFVRIAQALSPQLDEDKAEYIDGIKMGSFFNTVTKQFWDGKEGVVVIPCMQETVYMEFVPREQGGGFVGMMSPDNPDIRNTTRTGARETLPSGNELVKSDQHYCLLLGDDGMCQPVIIDMKSTALKVSRNWKTKIAYQKVRNSKGEVRTPPLFATMWRLRTVKESNDSGTWYNFVIDREDFVQDRNLLQEAKLFRDSIKKGEAKAVQEDQDSPRSSSSSDEVPF